VKAYRSEKKQSNKVAELRTYPIRIRACRIRAENRNDPGSHKLSWSNRNRNPGCNKFIVTSFAVDEVTYESWTNPGID
jgi:hypothetical protein